MLASPVLSDAEKLVASAIANNVRTTGEPKWFGTVRRLCLLLGRDPDKAERNCRRILGRLRGIGFLVLLDGPQGRNWSYAVDFRALRAPSGGPCHGCQGGDVTGDSHKQQARRGKRKREAETRGVGAGNPPFRTHLPATADPGTTNGRGGRDYRAEVRRIEQLRDRGMNAHTAATWAYVLKPETVEDLCTKADMRADANPPGFMTTVLQEDHPAEWRELERLKRGERNVSRPARKTRGLHGSTCTCEDCFSRVNRMG